jgi:hypothetical protein
MAIKSETRLGPYEIVSGIGAGGMGEVYRAILGLPLSCFFQIDGRFQREESVK